MAQTLGELMIKVGLDNTQFKQGMDQMDRSLKLAKAEFQTAAAQISDFGIATDKLKLKAESLNKEIEIQRQKVASLQETYTKLAAAEEADAAVVEKFQLKLLAAQKVLANMKSSLKKTTKELEIQGSAWTAVGTKMEAASTKMKLAGEKLAAMGMTLSLAVTAPIVAAGAASVKAAADYNETLSKTQVVFGESAKQVIDWSNTTIKSLGMANSTSMEMASTYGDMATSMGYTQQNAADLAMSIVNLAGDMSSLKNVPFDEVNTAMSSIFTGETESLKRLGIVMTQANIDQWLLSQGIRTSIKDMDQATQVQTRYNYVLAMSKNSIGDFARTSGSAANQMRTFPEAMKQLEIVIGQKLLPTLTPFITKITDLVNKFSQLSPKMQQNILMIAGIAAVVGPVLVILGHVLTGISSIISVVGAASTAIGAAGGATGALGAAFEVLSGPIGIAIAIIVGLVAAVKDLWQNNEGFRNKVKEIWGDIQAIITKVGEYLKAFWDKWGGDISAILQAAWNIIKAVFETAVQIIVDIFGAFLDLLQGDWRGAWEHVKNIFVELWAGIKTVIENAFNGLKHLSTILQGIGMDLIQGLIDGIKNKIMAIEQTVGEVADTIKNKFKDALGIASPSKVTHQYGLDTAQGFADGLSDGAGYIEAPVTKIVAKVVDLRNQIPKIIEDMNADLLKNQEDFSVKMQKVVEDRNTAIMKANQELADAEKQIMADAATQTQQVMEQFESQVKSKAESLANYTGLFDSVQIKAVSGNDLLGNLQDQVDQFDTWQKNINALAAKGIDEGLLEQLRNMGPQAAPQIAALNSMTSEQLNKYVVLWKQKQAMARAEANKEMDGARQDMNAKLVQIQVDAAQKLEQQRQQTQEKIEGIVKTSSEELEKLKAAWAEKEKEIKEASQKTVDEIRSKLEQLDQDATGYGVAVISNLISGITAMLPVLAATMETVNTTVGGYLDPNVRHSPSIVDRIRTGVKDITNAYAVLKNNLSSLGLQTALVGVTPAALGGMTTTNNNSSASTVNHIKINVNGGSGDIGNQVYSALIRKGVRFRG